MNTKTIFIIFLFTAPVILFVYTLYEIAGMIKI